MSSATAWPDDRRITIRDLQAATDRRERWSMLTSYDTLTAGVFEQAGVRALLVGDTSAEMVLGYPDTLPVTVDQLIPMVQAVVRGTRTALVVADLPFGSYQAGPRGRAGQRGAAPEGGRCAGGQAGGRPPGAASGRGADRGRHPVMGLLGLIPQASTCWAAAPGPGRRPRAGNRPPRPARRPPDSPGRAAGRPARPGPQRGALVGVRPRRALRRPGSPRPPDRRRPGVLPLPGLTAGQRGGERSSALYHSPNRWMWQPNGSCGTDVPQARDRGASRRAAGARFRPFCLARPIFTEDPASGEDPGNPGCPDLPQRPDLPR